MKSKFFANSSTIVLRLAVLFMGAVILVGTVVVLPTIFREWEFSFPEVAYFKIPVLIGLTSTIIAFYTAFYQTLKLLNLIDTGKAFSGISVKAFGFIKLSALAIAGIYAAGSPLAYCMAQTMDAPGLLLIVTIIIFAAVVIALMVAVLERLLKDAIALKAENDLTV